MLPWDWDIDTQVSGSTLAYMAKHYNNTYYDYVSKDDPPVKRTYLLDINPASIERERGNGLNIIDARWIDTRNGLYIDITGLSETHPDDQPGVWACKNYHRYQTTDLYPMRETIYEGVIAKVPYAYDRILTQEYHEKALVVTEFQGYVMRIILFRRDDGEPWVTLFFLQTPVGSDCQGMATEIRRRARGRGKREGS